MSRFLVTFIGFCMLTSNSGNAQFGGLVLLVIAAFGWPKKQEEWHVASRRRRREL